MKVVIFCGGLGTRLREQSETMPKPLFPIGNRPILWHLMRYYAHFGHREFVLCLGYQGHMIKEFFLNYNEALSNDFSLSHGGRNVELHGSDLDEWKITFIDTGLHSSIADRLLAVRPYLGDDDIFLANYSDGLSDLCLGTMVDDFLARDAIAGFVATRTPQSFHSVTLDDNGRVNRIGSLAEADVWINGGFFVFRREIFDYIEPGDELVEQPFQRLIARDKLVAFPHTGFWRAMDTFKDKISFDREYALEIAPWELWKTQPQGFEHELPFLRRGVAS